MEWQQYFEGFWFSFPVVIKLEQGLVTKGVLLIIQKRDYYQEIKDEYKAEKVIL